MGIDIKAGGRVKKTVRQTTSNNPYIRLLCKLYKFLARRTDSKFNKVINKRLNMTRTSRPPLSLSKIAANMANKEGKIACVVGTVTDDKRMIDVPKLTVCALRFTETARGRIVKAGGECLTFDKLALRSPLGKGTVLLRAVHPERPSADKMGWLPDHIWLANKKAGGGKCSGGKGGGGKGQNWLPDHIWLAQKMAKKGGGGKGWSGGGGWKKGGGKGWGKKKQGVKDPSKVVWVSGLAEGTTLQELKTHGETAGTAKWAEVYTKGAGAGTGIIGYATAEEAAAAIGMLSGSVLKGGMLQTDAYERKKK